MKFLALLSCLFISAIISAQIHFSSVSFNEALQKASAEGKIIFLQFEAADCNQCNDVANKGFDNKEVADKINQTFFCLKIDPQHPDRSRIAASYNLDANEGFGTLFIDNSGTIIHKFLKTTTFSKEYLNQIEVALMKAGENLKINELEKEYEKGNRSFGFLQVLLEKRRALNMPTDSLLDEYIDALPFDSLNSTSTLVFIAKMAPLLDSKADKALRKDQAQFNRAWYSMSLQMRVGINNTINFKSMEKAIKDKNEKYAIRTAAFAQATNSSNSAAGAKAYDKNMLRFYDETNDTTAYFKKSIAYFERYFLSVSPDSIKRFDSLNLQRMIGSAKRDTLKDGNKNKIVSTIAYAPTAQNFSRELNNGAYEFYKKTNNPFLLAIATEWIEKALEFYKTPQALDTYAKLLYKQGQNEKAIKAISEAIALQQKLGFPTKEYDSVLEKMKNEKYLEQ